MTRKHDPLTYAVLLLAGVAFAGSFDHVRETVAEHGQDGWLSWAIAAMPEVSVALVVVKLRRDGARGQVWAWIVGGSAMVFTAFANLAQAEPTVWGYVVAAWPVWASIGAAGLIEMGPPETSGTVAVVEPATVPGPAPQSVVVEDPRGVGDFAAWAPVVETQEQAEADVRAAQEAVRATRPEPTRPDVSDLLLAGQAVWKKLPANRRTYKAFEAQFKQDGHRAGTGRLKELFRTVRDQQYAAA